MNPFIDKFKMAGKVMDVCDSTARGLITTLQNAFNGLARVAHTGSYNDLTDVPPIPPEQVNSDWNATSGVAEILHKPTIPPPQVNSDWNATSGVAQILNKPTTLSGYGITDVYDKSYIDANMNAHNANLLQFFSDNTVVDEATIHAMQSGDTRVIQLYADLLSPSTNEVKIGYFTGLNFPSSGYWCGVVSSSSNSSLIGSWVLAGSNLYVKLNTTSYARIILTIVLIY